MGIATGLTHLHKRSGIYYCRIAIPKALIPALGRAEYKRSLRTSDFRQARIICRHISNRLETFFMAVTAVAPRDADIKALVRKHFERTLALAEQEYHFETVSSHSPFINEFSPEAIEQTATYTERNLASLTQLQKQHRYTPWHERVATAMLSTQGYRTPAPETFHRLCQGIVRAESEAERIKLAFYNAHYEAGDIKDPYFRDCKNFFQNPDPEYFEQAIIDAEQRESQPQTLEQAVEAYMAYRRDTERQSLSADNEARIRKFLRRMLDILGAHRPIAELDERNGVELERAMYRMPKHYARDHRKQGLSLIEASDADNEKLDIRTINAYLINQKAFFKWCHRNRYATVDVMQNIELRSKSLDEETRIPFSTAQLEKLFGSAIYTGRANKERMLWKRGNMRPRDGHFWLPLIALYTGMRMGEILYLQPSDIRCEDGVWYIDVNKDEDGKKLKTKQSIRQAPIHPDLVAVGFLDYVEKRKAEIGPKGALFSDGITLPKTQRITKNYSRAFSDYTLATGIREKKDGKVVFHSFRHNFHDAMFKAGNSNVITAHIAGHERPDEASTTGDKVYLHERPSLKVLYEAISRIGYGLDLSLLAEGGEASA